MVTNNLGQVNLMLIDDDPVSLDFVGRLLQQMGINNVVTAENGAQALDIFGVDATLFDVVICDIEMPELDGFEFVRRIRFGTIPKYRDIPILLLTGQSTDDIAKRARMHKIDGFIFKPPTANGLKNKICQVLGL